jgi:transposase-like protein
MLMSKRTFSKEEKLRIVKEASEQGVKLVLEKYDIYCLNPPNNWT